MLLLLLPPLLGAASSPAPSTGTPTKSLSCKWGQADEVLFITVSLRQSGVQCDNPAATWREDEFVVSVRCNGEERRIALRLFGALNRQDPLRVEPNARRTEALVSVHKASAGLWERLVADPNQLPRQTADARTNIQMGRVDLQLARRSS